MSYLYCGLLAKRQINPKYREIGSYDRRVLTDKLAKTFSDRRKDT